MTRPIHAVIVAYHAAEQLDRCLATLGTRVETTVIDNSSAPGVRAVADRPGVIYVDAGKNLGFGAGVNLALRPLLAGPPRDVLLLNPDAILDPCELDKLTQHLHREGNERLAAVSPRLEDPDGVEQKVAWPFPTPGRRLGGCDRVQAGAYAVLLCNRGRAAAAVGGTSRGWFVRRALLPIRRRSRLAATRVGSWLAVEPLQ